MRSNTLSRLWLLSNCYVRHSWRPIRFALLGLLWLFVTGLMAPVGKTDIAAAQRTDAGSRITEAWRQVYATQADTAVPSPSSGPPPSLLEYVTFSLGGEYTFNTVDFSNDPTVSFVVDDGPDLTLTPDGVSFPQVFESNDHKFDAYTALSTRGFGHSRVNTYISAILQHDLDGTTAGSPFQSILDDHDGDKLDLSNAFIEMNGLSAAGALSHMQVRLGRQFLPDLPVAYLGSAVIDGGRFAYNDARLDMALFAGRWVPFYDDASQVFMGGGRMAYQIFPKPASPVGLAPYIEFVHFNDTEQSMTTNRHTYGVQGRWKALEVDGYFAFIDEEPIEGSLRFNYISGKWSVYSRPRERVSSDDFTFDLFLTSEDLRRSNRLVLGALSPATEFTLDADYQLLSWLTVVRMGSVPSQVRAASAIRTNIRPLGPLLSESSTPVPACASVNK